MFAKINKRVLIIGAISLVAFLAIGLAFYLYLFSAKPEAEDTNIGHVEIPSEDEDSNASPSESGIEIIEKEGSPKGGLTICADKCGNGICENKEEDLKCKDGSPNCVCPESLQVCPQDCK
ncbi:MAG: hypothetical protein A3A98_03425 [Candidatus Staskawiczbacteria bacterium RIFCSPLOWO2_01_FULL_40_39]|uniref:Uncharacterized protein n=1 Tax=Candidatus Staskawiczbacteria bacterium RIFCSPHIGHO2_01_FULL_39_25 TaxID=1802202 RepID=A0A1G2HQA0_9BACT|nr:MAG: hypothetical protein A2730_02700 [Candidatus Staskawiczbacteria bacterium RIFCSPHIGHO2_01_FULL_39_25]OGZ72864.1 MAG: hypothetical protein A3A98_03425 [Candidatus Staskawiczbacteria bacterium RIFCSPLOWO2_01_FULL_40_39]OGZ75211.1 MAG: hypothetical protein A3I87_00865 [Candidatus Staskawiczbacteria bacterium RIFCSPLOWO2_02_FULL_39_8]